MGKISMSAGLLRHDVNQLHLVPSFKSSGFATPLPVNIFATSLNLGAL
jgi:hypothetical protein